MEFHLKDVYFADTHAVSSIKSSSELRADELEGEVAALQNEPKKWGLTATLFGRMEDGTSVCVHATGFEPELYYELSVDDAAIYSIARGQRHITPKLRIERVMRYDAGYIVLDEEGKRMPREYKRVAFSSLASYRTACYADDPVAHHKIPPIESKFFQHTNLVPEGWVRLDLARARPCLRKASWCTHEFDVDGTDALQPVARDDFAPIRCLAFDIEAVSEKEEFPDASDAADVVCQVSLVLWVVGEPMTNPPKRVCVCLRETAPIEGVDVISTATERDLLIAMRDTIIELDPDVIVQYNGMNFDLPYLDTRSTMCECPEFAYLSRLRFHKCRFEKKKMASSARGDQLLQYYAMPGRGNLDVMHWYMANYKDRVYSLNEVAFTHTGERKLDFSYKRIKPAFHGTPEERREMAEYCVQDSELLRVLCEQLKIFGDQIELARVCGVVMERLVTHGQQLKVISQLNRKCVAMRQFYPDHDFIMDSHTLRRRDADASEDEIGEGYEGATVIEPKKGYYSIPVIVMDFSSLYPSIMLGDNLCKSTILRNSEDFGKPGVVAHTISPGVTHHFSTINKGIIPAMLEETLARRKAAKNQKEKVDAARDALRQKADADTCPETQAKMRQLLSLATAFDKRQLALKISANSAYGFLGAEKTGKFADKAVAATVTKCGRDMLMESCETCKRVSLNLGRDSDGQTVGQFELVYGDSVAAYTPLLLRDPVTRNVSVTTCDRLIEDTAWWSTPDGKEMAPLDLETWTEDGWTRIQAVIRHEVAKPLYRVTTSSGIVDVTADHSLLTMHGDEVSPTSCGPGDRLMHATTAVCLVHSDDLNNDDAHDMGLRVGRASHADRAEMVERVDIPDAIYHASFDAKRSFLAGVHNGSGGSSSGMCTMMRFDLHHTIIVRDEAVALGVIVIARSLGCLVTIKAPVPEDLRLYAITIFRPPYSMYEEKGGYVRDVQPISYHEQYVYDLTTANHHFQAGVGELVVHNTDSLMVTLSNVHTPYDGHHAGVAMSAEVTRMFHERGQYSKKLEQEKVFMPWILFKKKRYCGEKFEENHEGKIVSRGITHSGTANKRRDSCKFVGKMYDAMVNPLMKERDRDKAVAAFHEFMRMFVQGRVHWDDLVITKSLQSSYKNQNLAQCQVVAKQRAREPGSEAKPGSRLKLVYVEGARGAKVSELAEDADYAETNNLKIDTVLYIKSQLSTPALSILELIHPNPQRLIDAYIEEAHRIRSKVPTLTSFLKCDVVRVPSSTTGASVASSSSAPMQTTAKRKTNSNPAPGAIDKFLKKK